MPKDPLKQALAHEVLHSIKKHIEKGGDEWFRFAEASMASPLVVQVRVPPHDKQGAPRYFNIKVSEAL